MHRVTELVSRATALPLLVLIKIYQVGLSPWLGGTCRHVPSCSAYADEAIRRLGPARGAWLTLKRLARCHPWGTSGYDPVPERPAGRSTTLHPGKACE